MTTAYDGVPCAELAARLDAPGLLCLDEVGSVLDLVHDLAAEGAREGSVVLAEQQLRGRGRQGRPWLSPRGGGIWLGYLARPGREPASGVLALRVGLAVADALRGLGAEVRVKWPNDVYLDDRKLAGILCEARETWVAIGIGANVHGPLPAELDGGAATLAECLPDVSRVAVLERVVPRLHRLAQAAELTDGERRLFAELDWLRGRRIVEPLAGTACGVAADGALLVDTGRGTTRVTAGTVRAA